VCDPEHVPQEEIELETMDSHVADRQLMQYAARLLSTKESEQIGKHIQRCSDCEFRLRAVERAQEILRTAKPVPR